MLVLTRRANQSIVIGGDIVVTVLEVKGDQIRLGITAPRDVQVHRDEIYAALSEANRGSVVNGPVAPGIPAPRAPRPRGARHSAA